MEGGGGGRGWRGGSGRTAGQVGRGEGGHRGHQWKSVEVVPANSLCVCRACVCVPLTLPLLPPEWSACAGGSVCSVCLSSLPRLCPDRDSRLSEACVSPPSQGSRSFSLCSPLILPLTAESVKGHRALRESFIQGPLNCQSTVTKLSLR